MKIRLLEDDFENGCHWLSTWHDSTNSPTWSSEEKAMELSIEDAQQRSQFINRKYPFYACRPLSQAQKRSDDPKFAILQAMKNREITKEEMVIKLRELARKTTEV